MLERAPITVATGQFEDIVARGLQGLIEDDETLRLVAAGVANHRLPEVFGLHRPDVAILNFAAFASAAEFRDLHLGFPTTRLVVLANNPSPSECRQMLAFGATACLSNSIEARDVLHAIHLASRGIHVLPPATIGPAPTGPDVLTPREAEVLELLQIGRSNAEIADTLGVGVETVRTHARRIYRKLGVSTRRELRTRR
jgi:DNA-binding NarL/FixJ family response regulator